MVSISPPTISLLQTALLLDLHGTLIDFAIFRLKLADMHVSRSVRPWLSQVGGAR